MNSCLYRGSLRHRRHTPVLHELNYQMFMLCLDLDELPNVFRGARLWSADKRNVAAVHQKDYFDPLARDVSQKLDSKLSLKQRVIGFVKQEAGIEVTGKIMLLTHGRYFGHNFNPVSFYYCYNQADELLAIVSDITNTPWNERHAYVLPVKGGDFTGHKETTKSGKHSFQFDKKFHVSPFNPLDMQYAWHFSEPGEKLWVYMDVKQNNERHFDARLILEQEALSPVSLNKMLWDFPLMTVKVVFGIYWHALRLWFKKSPFYDHPETTPKLDQASFEKK